MEINGTIIEVRNLFEISAAVSNIFKRQAAMQLEFSMCLLNKYSMILKGIALVITGGKLIRKATKMIEEKVRCKWQTHGCDDLYGNLKYIL